jgi:hypothetical protein
MTPMLIEAGLKLAGLLAEENRLLTAMDLVAAAALNPRKQQAVAGFVAARGQAKKAPPPPAQERAALVKLSERLVELSRHNQALLERGLAAQSQMIETLAGIAARPAAPGYAPPPRAPGAAGFAPLPAPIAARPPAFALNAQA